MEPIFSKVHFTTTLLVYNHFKNKRKKKEKNLILWPLPLNVRPFVLLFISGDRFDLAGRSSKNMEWGIAYCLEVVLLKSV